MSKSWGKRWAMILGAAMILAAGFSAELLASRTCCCSQICDEPDMWFITAADKSPPEVASALSTFQTASGLGVAKAVALDVEAFDAAVWSDFGELPATYEVFATTAADWPDLFQYAVSVSSFSLRPSVCNQSRARNSYLYAKSPRDLIITRFASMQTLNPKNLRWF